MSNLQLFYKSNFIFVAQIKSNIKSENNFCLHFWKAEKEHTPLQSGYFLSISPTGKIELFQGAKRTCLAYAEAPASLTVNFTEIKLTAANRRISFFLCGSPSPLFEIPDDSYTKGYIEYIYSSEEWTCHSIRLGDYLPPPSELIAYKTGNYTRLAWKSEKSYAGYNVYSRPNEASDGNFSLIAYKKLTDTPIKETEYLDTPSNVTYRVTALSDDGIESSGSDMVFPISHSGVEILHIAFLNKDGTTLTHIPDNEVNISISVINSTENFYNAVIDVHSLSSKGHILHTYKKDIQIPCDGVMNNYTFPLTSLPSETASLAAQLFDCSGIPISTVFRYRPTGISLTDTLFEQGLYLNIPEYELLYDNLRDSWMIIPSSEKDISPSTLLDGQVFSDCKIEISMQYTPHAKKCILYIFHSADENNKIIGGLQLTYSPNGSLELLQNGRKIVSHIYNPLETKLIKLTIIAENGMIKVYCNNNNLPVMTAETNGCDCGMMSYDEFGWNIKALKIYSQKNTFAGILPFGSECPDPVWNIACWHTTHNWITENTSAHTVSIPNGAIVTANQARSIEKSYNGTIITIEAKGSMEYSHPRLPNEPWSHLLLEITRQNGFGKEKKLLISGMRSLWFTVDVRMLQCENRTDNYDPGIHAGQFVMYFNIRGKNNEAMWLSLSGLDSRNITDSGKDSTIYQMDPGTNTFIIAPAHNTYWSGHLADGQWHTMSIDLKAIIFDSYSFGKSIGAFSESNFKDLYLNSTNFGFELPGSFDMKFSLGNIQLFADIDA